LHCLLCHFQHLVFMNSKKQLRKGLVGYYKTSGITCLQKHLGAYIQQFIKGFKNKLIMKGNKMLRNNLQKKGFLFPILPY